MRTAPPVPPVRPRTEASALIVPAAADPVRRRGAGARPDGVFSGAPWHRPARPPCVIPPHDGAVERQREAMGVVDDPSRDRTSMRCPPCVRSSTSLICAACDIGRHGDGVRAAPIHSDEHGGRALGVVLETCGTTGVERRARGFRTVSCPTPRGSTAAYGSEPMRWCHRAASPACATPRHPEEIVIRWEPAAVRRGLRGPPRGIRARKTQCGP